MRESFIYPIFVPNVTRLGHTFHLGAFSFWSSPNTCNLLVLPPLVSHLHDGSPLRSFLSPFLTSPSPRMQPSLQPWHLSQARFPGLTLSHADLLHLFPWSPANHSSTECDSASSFIQQACLPVSHMPSAML